MSCAKYHWPLAPMVLSFILGPLLEKNLIQALSMSGGSPLIFVQRGLTLGLLVAALVVVVLSLWLMRTTVKRVELGGCKGRAALHDRLRRRRVMTLRCGQLVAALSLVLRLRRRQSVAAAAQQYPTRRVEIVVPFVPAAGPI